MVLIGAISMLSTYLNDKICLILVVLNYHLINDKLISNHII